MFVFWWFYITVLHHPTEIFLKFVWEWPNEARQAIACVASHTNYMYRSQIIWWNRQPRDAWCFTQMQVCPSRPDEGSSIIRMAVIGQRGCNHDLISNMSRSGQHMVTCIWNIYGWQGCMRVVTSGKHMLWFHVGHKWVCAALLSIIVVHECLSTWFLRNPRNSWNSQHVCLKTSRFGLVRTSSRGLPWTGLYNSWWEVVLFVTVWEPSYTLLELCTIRTKKKEITPACDRL